MSSSLSTMFWSRFVPARKAPSLRRSAVLERFRKKRLITQINKEVVVFNVEPLPKRSQVPLVGPDRDIRHPAVQGLLEYLSIMLPHEFVVFAAVCQLSYEVDKGIIRDVFRPLRAVGPVQERLLKVSQSEWLDLQVPCGSRLVVDR